MAYYNNSIKAISLFYPELLWRKKVEEKIIYLTFDDGPVPEATPFVLEQLDKYQSKATFFCVGQNLEKNPELFLEILKRGHAFGNHTYNHVNGWNTDDELYVQNSQQCQSHIDRILSGHAEFSLEHNKRLFRPPYGKIKKSQIRKMQGQYNIVMWSALTGDFDAGQSPEACLKQAIDHTTKGSILIFHDSVKAWKSLEYALPRYLDHFTKAGYRFEKL